MPYYAVAFPKLSQRDADWIETYRTEHDPENVERIRGHFTFVFGIDCAEGFFLDELKKQLAHVPPIAFELRLATLNMDARTGIYLEHLVPEKGYAAMAMLHDKLYEDGFTAHQRLDLGYIPHMTIGRCEKPVDGKTRIKALNAQGVSIKGRIETITAFSEWGGTNAPVATFTLSAS